MMITVSTDDVVGNPRRHCQRTQVHTESAASGKNWRRSNRRTDEVSVRIIVLTLELHVVPTLPLPGKFLKFWNFSLFLKDLERSGNQCRFWSVLEIWCHCPEKFLHLLCFKFEKLAFHFYVFSKKNFAILFTIINDSLIIVNNIAKFFLLNT